MATEIHVFSETLQNGQWTADNAASLIVEPPARFGWVKATMDHVECPNKYWLFGLLVDEFRYSWPWSFHEKGLPDDVTPETKAVSDSWGIDGYAHSHLSVQELREKYMELLVSHKDEAKEISDYLSQLIAAIPKTTEDPCDQRIVFWFDN